MGSHLSLLVSATMLVATLVYYYRMVLLTELTTEASLFNTLYAEYGTSQMHDSIQAVEAFSHATPLSYKQIVCKKSDEQLWDRALDHDWQRIYHWYQKLVYFHRLGLLSDRFYREFPGTIRARHFVQHVEPFAVNSCQLYKVRPRLHLLILIILMDLLTNTVPDWYQPNPSIPNAQEQNCTDVFDYLRDLYALPAAPQVSCEDNGDASQKTTSTSTSTSSKEEL